MLWASWGKWPDVFIDFGRELYVPWMLGQGNVLYRDLLYFHGPLAPYLNALWFTFFGVSLETIVSVNIAITFLLAAVIYLTMKRCSSPPAAFIACLIFILLFAFNQYVLAGNYNYICPYSHEITHGMFFSWIALYCIIEFLSYNKLRWLAISGACAGLVFLTKLEFSFALIMASASACLIWIYIRKPKPAALVKHIGLYVGMFCVFPFAAAGLLAMKMPLPQAITGVLGGWWHVFTSSVSGNQFFHGSMGTDNPVNSLTAIFSAAAIYLCLLGPAAIGSLKIINERIARYIAAASCLAVFVLSGLFWNKPFWMEAGRPLPLALACFAVLLAPSLIRRYSEKKAAAVILVVFSITLLAKIILNTSLHHYGFALAMPAAMVSAVALFNWVPVYIDRKGGQKIVYIAVAFALTCVVVVRYNEVSVHAYYLKKVPVGTGTDAFLADKRGIFAHHATEWLKENAGPDDTLAVLPEGSILNYLARIPGSNRVVSTFPTDLAMFGEENMLHMLKQNPPTFIAFVHRDDSEYGAKYFGRDYARLIMSWAREKYSIVWQLGNKPFQDRRFGVEILKYQPPQ